MFPEQLSFRFSIVTLAILFACSSTANGDFYGDLRSKVNDAYKAITDAAITYACVADHRSDFKRCWAKMKYAYDDHSNYGDDDFCCQLLEYRDCVEKITDTYCGKNATQVTEKVLRTLKNSVLQCDGIFTAFYCWFIG